MQVVSVFYVKDFKAETSKEAYEKACKWYAKNVMSKKSKVEESKVMMRTSIIDHENFICRLELFVMFDDEEFNKGRCDACAQFHNLFYINEQYNCEKCSQRGYRADLNRKIERISDWFKRQLDTTQGNQS